MPPHTLHVVQAFEQQDGGIVPVEPKACPSAASARALRCTMRANLRRRHRLVADRGS
jgi:hypothetical protein